MENPRRVQLEYPDGLLPLGFIRRVHVGLHRLWVGGIRVLFVDPVVHRHVLVIFPLQLPVHKLSLEVLVPRVRDHIMGELVDVLFLVNICDIP